MARRISLFALLALAACFDQQTNDAPEDAGHFDAPTFDGTIPDSSNPDSPIADTSLPEVEAGPKLVTVVVRNELGPEQGVTIVFHDPNGAVISSGITNAAGLVAQLVPSGSMMTALMGSPTTPRPVTVQGVEPGDVLTAFDDSNPTFLNDQIAVDSVPSPPPAETIGYFAGAGRCSAYFNTPPAQIGLSNGCEIGGRAPLLITAAGGPDAGYANVGYTFQKANALPGDGGTLHISPDGGWTTTFTTQTLSATGMSDAGGFGGFSFMEVTGNVPAWTTSGFPTAPLDGGPLNQPFQGHPGYADFVQGEANIVVFRSGSSSVAAIATRGAAPTTSTTTSLDLSQILPLISAATLDSTTPARPSVTWTADGSLASTDGAVVVIRWITRLDGGGTASGTWTIVLPPTATIAKAPTLPSTAAAWAPDATSTFLSPPFVFFIDGSFLPGYAQLRAITGSFSALGNATGNPPIVPPLPVDGTMRITGFTVSGD